MISPRSAHDRRRPATALSRLPFFVVAALMATSLSAIAQANPPDTPTDTCAGDNRGITLSPGFCATVFADNLGHARQMAFAPNGALYVNTWSGRYYHNGKPPAGGFLVALKDTKGDGHANVIERFGAGVPQGSAGGTGLRIYNGGLYAEQNDKIVRYSLSADGVVPKTEPQVVLSGLPLTGDHPMHPFIIDAEGHMFVDLGSATNSCQLQNRIANSPGHQPCSELRLAAVPGSTMRAKRVSISHLRSAMPQGCATAKDLHSISPDAFSSHSMAVTNSRRIGRLCSHPSKAQSFRQRRLSNLKKAPTTVGLHAISTGRGTSSCWRRNMAATARRWESAPAKKLLSHPFPGIGRRMIF